MITKFSSQHYHTAYKNRVLPVFIILACMGIMVCGDLGRELFQYQNAWRQEGQYWRLMTGHFTHLGWSHFFLNIAGFVLVWFMYGKIYRARIWLGILFFTSIGISLGFYYLDTHLQSYVGLSGVLHGLIGAGIVGSVFQSHQGPKPKFHWEDVFIGVGLCAKITYEKIIGVVPLTESVSGGGVIVNAHLYGAIIGVLCSVIIIFFASENS
ncbi:MAG: rhombosortase [Robiginitomaculum sp.]|nr:rhombosortase [Robiginitomaculum sp.]